MRAAKQRSRTVTTIPVTTDARFTLAAPITRTLSIRQEITTEDITTARGVQADLRAKYGNDWAVTRVGNGLLVISARTPFKGPLQAMTAYYQWETQPNQPRLRVIYHRDGEWWIVGRADLASVLESGALDTCNTLLRKGVAL